MHYRLGLYLRNGIHEVSAIGFSPVSLVSTMVFLLAGFTSAVSEGLKWRDSGGYFSSVLIFNCMLKRIFNKLNPMLCMGVATPVDTIIFRPSVFKITVKEIL